jgi:hypothetical protein
MVKVLFLKFVLGAAAVKVCSLAPLAGRGLG